jgi:capsular polysaccharide transport system permease protein
MTSAFDENSHGTLEVKSSSGALAYPKLPTAGALVDTVGRGLQGRRVRRWLTSFVRASFLAIVVLPTLVAGVYLAFFASNRYTAEFRVSVRSAGALTGGAGLTQLLGLSNMSQSGIDSNSIVQYLESREAVGDLDKSIGLRSLYDSLSIDRFSRLRRGASAEEFARYWNKMLEAYYETTTGTIVVKVTAFSPTAAEDIAQSTLQLSEQLVNRMSLRQRDDAVASAQDAVKTTRQEMETISRRFQSFRDTQGILDPRLTGQTIEKLSGELQEQIVKASTNLESSRRYLSEDAPSVQQQQQYLTSLQNALARIKGEATSSSTDPSRPKGDRAPLSNVLGTFEQLQSDELFADKAYEAALTAQETAKLDAVRQQVYLSTIVRPEMPQEPSYPKPMMNTGSILALAFFGWLILLFGVSSVREHL